MSDRLTLLLISVFCIVSAFFIGLYFGRSLDAQIVTEMNKNLQVSLDIHGNTIKTERSNAAIRVIVNGAVIVGTGTVEIAK